MKSMFFHDNVHCCPPINKSTNVFQPGDINAMFERLLMEAGHDNVTSFSRENRPTRGILPGIGELMVITSPYHDPPSNFDMMIIMWTMTMLKLKISYHHYPGL